jgi:monofunctional biosynthetic peptidoglycan transglycosylase
MRWLIRFIKWSLLFVAALYVFWISTLVMLKWIDPPTTGVQIQRYIEATIAGKPYRKKMVFKPLSQISVQLPHAVIASEDERFYTHHGVDWEETRKVAEESQENGKMGRGASTITQQLVKNLFFTTHRNPVRKAFEYTLAPLADTILGKQRELELYLNIVEWGPGVWGAEAASQYHYHIPAAKLDREQAARLAACLPSPLRYKPAKMNDFSASIMDRMRMMNW